jgi:hypothetical protein
MFQKKSARFCKGHSHFYSIHNIGSRWSYWQKFLDLQLWSSHKYLEIKISKPDLSGQPHSSSGIPDSPFTWKLYLSLLIFPSFPLPFCLRIISRRTLRIWTAFTSCSLWALIRPGKSSICSFQRHGNRTEAPENDSRWSWVPSGGGFFPPP